MDLIQFSYVIVMSFKVGGGGGGGVGKVLIHHTILKTQSAPPLGRSKRSVPWEL